MQNILLVFLGGGLGSVSRYLLGRIVLNYIGSSLFPLGTFLANITGCFLIGLILASLERPGGGDIRWALLLATGFCGGFTTFSSFAYENILLIRQNEYVFFILYTGASFIFGLAFVFLGISLAKYIFS